LKIKVKEVIKFTVKNGVLLYFGFLYKEQLTALVSENVSQFKESCLKSFSEEIQI